MKYQECQSPDEVCEWCNTHPGCAIISITSAFHYSDGQYVIFYEDFSNHEPERIAAHNIDPGFAIPSTGTPMPATRYPSYVSSGDRPKVAEPIC